MGKEMILTNEELAENKLLNDAIAFAVEKHKDGLRNVYQMHGNQIAVKTLDLNKEFSEIARQLDEIVQFGDFEKVG